MHAPHTATSITARMLDLYEHKVLGFDSPKINRRNCLPFIMDHVYNSCLLGGGVKQ
jgi:hypothetical protein